jgi:hypothetical protein
MRRYVFFHGKRHPAGMGAAEITRFLTSLAIDGKVAASTQNQALSALLFLYREVLHQEGAPRRQHDHDLHPRSEPGPGRGPEPRGPDPRRMIPILPGWRRPAPDQTRRFRRTRPTSLPWREPSSTPVIDRCIPQHFAAEFTLPRAPHVVAFGRAPLRATLKHPLVIAPRGVGVSRTLRALLQKWPQGIPCLASVRLRYMSRPFRVP